MCTQSTGDSLHGPASVPQFLLTRGADTGAFVLRASCRVGRTDHPLPAAPSVPRARGWQLGLGVDVHGLAHQLCFHTGPPARCFAGLGLVAAQEEPWPQKAQLHLGPTSRSPWQRTQHRVFTVQRWETLAPAKPHRSHGALRAGNDSVSSAFPSLPRTSTVSGQPS